MRLIVPLTTEHQEPETNIKYLIKLECHHRLKERKTPKFE